MTYKEFCEAVDKADFITVQAGPYTCGAGEFSSSIPVDKYWAKEHVDVLLKMRTKVYALFTPTESLYINGKIGDPADDCEWQLITP